MSRNDWLISRPIAHRGLHDAGAGIVENTRSAVTAALEARYAIEVDLQLSADNRVMVFHDTSLSRLTEADGLLKKLTSDKLQNIRFKDTSDRMLALEELLALVDGQTPLILEIKSHWTNVGPLEALIAKTLETYTGPVAVMSFDPNSVAEFRKLAPYIPRGIVTEAFRDDKYWGFLSWGQKITLRNMLHWFKSKPDFVAFDIENLISIAPQVTRLLLRKPLLTWTVRTEADVKRARVFADNIIFENFRP
jgi:glycerophosphoryl diester phosphodiesterase